MLSKLKNQAFTFKSELDIMILTGFAKYIKIVITLSKEECIDKERLLYYVGRKQLMNLNRQKKKKATENLYTCKLMP